MLSILFLVLSLFKTSICFIHTTHLVIFYMYNSHMSSVLGKRDTDSSESVFQIFSHFLQLPPLSNFFPITISRDMEPLILAHYT